MKLSPLMAIAGALQAQQLVDSASPSTRRHWRKMLGATDQEADDVRPFSTVMAQRDQQTG